MKCFNMPKIIKNNPDIFLVILLSLLLTFLCFSTQSSEKSPLLYLRWVLGIFFIYVVSGYPFTVALYSKNELNFLERLMMSSGISMVLTYPAGIINEMYEGKINVFIPHLTGDMLALNSIVLIGSILALKERNRKNEFFVFHLETEAAQFAKDKIAILLSLNLFLFFIFSLINIDKAGIYNDEWNLIKQSYNLVDGNLAARTAYTISFVDHSPLGIFIGHFAMQLINPLGLHMVNEVWVFRISSVIVGVLGILFVYILGRNMFNNHTGLIASILVAVSGYYVIMTSLYYPRDGAYQMVFMIITLYFFWRSANRRDLLLCGFFLGAAMLIKFTSVLLVPVIYFLNLEKTRKILDRGVLKIFLVAFITFSPVIFYNMAAYLITGYTDVPFSKLLGNPNSPNGPNIREYTGEPFAFQNLMKGINILYEQFSVVIFALFVIATVYAVYRIHKKYNRYELSIYVVWVAGTFLFFWVAGVEPWHLASIIAPFAILSGYFITNTFNKNKFKIPGIILLLFLLLYSLNFAYGISISDSTFKQNRFFPDYGSEEMKNFLRQNYNVSDNQIIVVADEFTHSVIGWSISTIILQKMHLSQYEYPELKGVKDMNYERIEFLEKSAVTFNNRTLIVSLSNFSLNDTSNYNKTIVIIPYQTEFSQPGESIAHPGQINPERYEVYKKKSEYIRTNYNPSRTIFDVTGNPIFYIYVF